MDMARRWTVCCGVVFAISTLWPATRPTPARTQMDDDARSVIAGCHDATKNGGQPQTFDAGMCLGIIKGLHYLSPDICIPPTTSLRQIADVVSKYVDSHAGKMQDDFRETSLEAMRSAWPCGERHDI
jgi:hypothetical protein